ncbi:MAG: DNA (cytosine-5)-methyltransferase 1, partial [Rubritalea sp.]
SQSSRNGKGDDRWSLLKKFGALIHETKPDMVTMENVPQLLKHEVFDSFLDYLEGYSVAYGIVECENYSIPQTRKRLVLIASKISVVTFQDILDQRSSEKATVKKTIGHLEKIEAGQGSAEDPIHMSPRLSPLNYKRIKVSKPGGTWRDWDEKLRANCHKKESGATYPSVYGRMDWDKPSPTITTQCFGYGNGRFGHPEQNRAISLREAAILQSFPDDYIFLKPSEKPRFSAIGRLIGNAVPVKVGEIVGNALVKSIERSGIVNLSNHIENQS